jgi:hypothetical protein
MKILVDYYIGETNRHIMHTVIEESDLIEMLETKFRNGELACPMYYDKETVKVEFNIDEIRI